MGMLAEKGAGWVVFRWVLKARDQVPGLASTVWATRLSLRSWGESKMALPVDGWSQRSLRLGMICIWGQASLRDAVKCSRSKK